MGLEKSSGSSGSGAAADSSQPRDLRWRLEVYNDVLRQLRDAGVPEAQSPSFEDELRSHFNRLPYSYALEVDEERPEDVLAHKKLLDLAQEAENTPVFAVRLVQFCFRQRRTTIILTRKNTFHYKTNGIWLNPKRPMHEIIFAMLGRPKLLILLTSLLSKIGLNIQKAHVFSTKDGYSLDVFVVDGWPYEETKQLMDLLQEKTQLKDLDKRKRFLGARYFIMKVAKENS